jgi:hypothetical protein
MRAEASPRATIACACAQSIALISIGSGICRASADNVDRHPRWRAVFQIGHRGDVLVAEKHEFGRRRRFAGSIERNKAAEQNAKNGRGRCSSCDQF